MFRIIYLKGDMFRIIYLKGDMLLYFFPEGRFHSGQPILHFIYLPQFDWPKMTYTEFTFIAFTTLFFFSKLSSSHEIMVERRCWARLYRQGC